MNTPLPPMGVPEPIVLGNVHLTPHEREKQKILNAIQDLCAMGMSDGAEKMRLKFKHILDPEVPVKTEAWLKQYITADPHMLKVKKQVSVLCKHDDTVLIQGPTGTGKEMLASALHGDRKPEKFIGINCAGLPDGLIESELFGHVKGSFTGAAVDKPGLFSIADTIFLDEIGELPPGVQAKLLRVLQERTIRKVGGNTYEAITCRVVAATHRDLAAMVMTGTFREDLFYRLNTFHLRLTPLVERPDDIPLVTIAYADAVEAKAKAENRHIHPWPREYKIKPSLLGGNVRSVQQIVRRYHVLGELPAES